MQINYSTIDDKYKVLGVLGTGFTSKVLLASKVDNDEKVAIKIYIPRYTIDFKSLFNKEIELMKLVEHPNILRVIEHGEGVYKSPNEYPKSILFIVFELCENTDIFEFIKISGKLDDKMTRFMFHKMLNAVKFLHEQKLCHRDIKLENIFLNSKYDIIIGDFGFAKLIDSKTFSTKVGTKNYQSPQIMENKEYIGEENDIFSLGVVLFIIYFGAMPFADASKSNFRYKHIKNGNYEEFWNLIKKSSKTDDISPSFKTLINGMLSYKDRSTIEDIEKSEWFNGPICTYEEYFKEMDTRKKEVEKQKEKYNLALEMCDIPEYKKRDDDKVYRSDVGDDEEVQEIDLEKMLDEIGVENLDISKWNDYKNVSGPVYIKLNMSPKKSLYYLLNTLQKLYPKIKYEFVSNTFSVNAKFHTIEEFENEDEQIEIININNMDINIDFYESKDDTVIQFLKGSDMHYFDFKTCCKELKKSLLSQDY